MDKDPELHTFKSGTRRFKPAATTLPQAQNKLRKSIADRPMKRYRTRGYTPEELAVSRLIGGGSDES